MSGPANASLALAAIVGKTCWRKRAGEFGSLSLGFGAKLLEPTSLGPREYGEWEVGSYNAAWRVTANDDVLCGSEDASLNRDRANEVLASLELGSAISWEATANAIRLNFDMGRAVEFLRVNSSQEEWFHVFAPGDAYFELSGAGIWAVGPSGVPWAR
ncbi:MAG: hypothetical protein ACRD1C_03400 [Terriglobales bacterium]